MNSRDQVNPQPAHPSARVDNYSIAAASADPEVSADLDEVSEGVFVISDNRVPFVPNIGIVVGRDAVLVIDTGIGPRNGAVVLDHARRVGGGRMLYLVLTQVDPGHGFGAQAFKGAATIIYSNAQHYRLKHHAASYVHTFETLNAAVAARLAGLEFVDCDISYERRLEIELGGTRAVLRQWGPAHTVDDQTIHIDNRVLFAGDLTQTRMFPILPYFPPFDTHFDGRRWIDALDRLIADPPAIVVPGHGELTDVEQIIGTRDYLRYMLSRAHQHWISGIPAKEAAAAIASDAQHIWATWEGPRNIRHLVVALYAQFNDER